MFMNLFSSLTVSNSCIVTLKTRSVLNKSAIIKNHIIEKNYILCITETWIKEINYGQFINSLLSSLLYPIMFFAVLWQASYVLR